MGMTKRYFVYEGYEIEENDLVEILKATIKRKRNTYTEGEINAAVGLMLMSYEVLNRTHSIDNHLMLACPELTANISNISGNRSKVRTLYLYPYKCQFGNCISPT